MRDIELFSTSFCTEFRCGSFLMGPGTIKKGRFFVEVSRNGEGPGPGPRQTRGPGQGSQRAQRGSREQVFKGQGSQKDPNGVPKKKNIRAKGPKRAQRGPRYENK